MTVFNPVNQPIMKRIALIIALVITIFAATSCQDGNVAKLKKEIAVANASCPINMGIGGDLLSIKYQEKENRVILYYSVNEELSGGLFLKKNKEKLHQQFRLSFSKSDSQQMLKDIVNAKASLMMIYKAPSSGKTVKFELPYEELKEMRSNPMSDSEIQRLTIETKTDVENSRCPYKSDEGMVVTKVSLVDGYIVWNYEMDEDLYDMKELKQHQSELKENAMEALKSMRKDPYMQKELRMLVEQNIGYRYHYYGNNSQKHIDIIFTPEELSKFISY